MANYPSNLIKVAKDWLGCNESNGSHKQIIDLYNSHKPLARGYKVKYTDEWCATFVSACAIKSGMTAIIPTECSCEKMITLFKNIGSWQESDNHVPSQGDIIFYDWQDSGSGDNVGWSDHVGIVESCDGTNIVIIEGNYSQSVKRRTIKVNGKYIRGFGVPKYDKHTTTNTGSGIVTATSPAKSYSKSIAGKYKVTASGLHLRNGAGVSHKSLCVLPQGTIVNNYGYYTTVSDVKWLLVQTTVNGVKYTGFSSSNYLQRA